MKERTSTSLYLDSTITLLVQHFGGERVQKSLLKAIKGVDGISPNNPEVLAINTKQRSGANITGTLELLRQQDEETYLLLRDFYTAIKEQKVLPESQDIQQFAYRIGLKEITGKSRKDMIPKLMRFLCDLPRARLQAEIEKAARISEEERQQGYSILTDKLLGER